MGAPEERPGRGDRRRARATIRRACAEGRIVEADRDLRLAQVDEAGTNTELAGLVRGLEPDPAFVRPQPAQQQPQPVPQQPQLPSQSQQPPRPWSVPARTPTVPRILRGPGSSSVVPLLVVVPAVVVVAVVGVVVSIVVAATSSTSGPTTYATPAAPTASAVDLLQPAALEELLAQLRSRTDGGRVYDLTVYPTYALARAPGRDGRDHLYRWSGGLADIGTSTTSGDRPTVDVRDVRADVLLDVLATARREIDPDPSTQYVRLAPALGDDDGVLRAFVSGAGHTGFVTATREGRVLRVVGGRGGSSSAGASPTGDAGA